MHRWRCSVQGSVTGLPVIGAVSAGGGRRPGGPVGLVGRGRARPRSTSAGRSCGRSRAARSARRPAGRPRSGSGLDDTAPTDAGHRELAARWRQAGGLGVSWPPTGPGRRPSTRTRAPKAWPPPRSTRCSTSSAAGSSASTTCKTMLDNAVGTKTVRFVLEGSVLEPAAPGRPAATAARPRSAAGRASCSTMAGQLAAAAPSVTVGPFTFGIANDRRRARRLAVDEQRGRHRPHAGRRHQSLHLEVDASWIDPPAAVAAPGIVLDLLTVSGAEHHPGARHRRQRGRPAARQDQRPADRRRPAAGQRRGAPVRQRRDSARTPCRELAGGVQVELGGLAVPLGSGGGDNAVAQGHHERRRRQRRAAAPSVQPGGRRAGPRHRASPSPCAPAAATARGSCRSSGRSARSTSSRSGSASTTSRASRPRQLEMISLYLDGQVSLLGLTAAVDKLRFGYHVSRPVLLDPSSWEVDVDGFAIASDIGGLTPRRRAAQVPARRAAQRRRVPGHAQDRLRRLRRRPVRRLRAPDDAARRRVRVVLRVRCAARAASAASPAFFITGIGVGFGINRELHTPTIDEVNTHPFMQALRALGPTPEPMQQLQDMRAIVPPAQGEYWVAAGISFTSFVLITGEILVTVQFGDGLEIAILGLARAQLPTPDRHAGLDRAGAAGAVLDQGGPAARPGPADRELVAAGPSRCGSPAASPSQTWWKGPNAGQFVITVGGYHPRFHHDGYPVVPRVGLSWQPIDNISIVGGVYFALCSEAIMAGAGMQVAAHLGPAHASLRFGGDGIVFFDPFWFEVDVYAEARGRHHDLAAVRQRRHRRLARLRRHGRGPADPRRGPLQRLRASRSRSSSATRQRPGRPGARCPASSPTSTCAATPTPRSCRPRCSAAG